MFTQKETSKINIIFLFFKWIWYKKKHALNYKIKQELHKYKILSLPRYDEENDRFVLDIDAPNADEFFKQQ